MLLRSHFGTTAGAPAVQGQIAPILTATQTSGISLILKLWGFAADKQRQHATKVGGGRAFS